MKSINNHPIVLLFHIIMHHPCGSHLPDLLCLKNITNIQYRSCCNTFSINKSLFFHTYLDPGFIVWFFFFYAFFVSFPEPSNPTAWDMSDGKSALPRKHETEQMWRARCAGSWQSLEKERSGWDQGEKQCRECVGCCSVSSAGDVMPTIVPPMLLCAKRNDMRCKALRQAEVCITKPHDRSAG